MCVPWLYSLTRGKHKKHSLLQLCGYNFTKGNQLWGFSESAMFFTFSFLLGLFSTNLDLLGPQLFHFHQDYNVKTGNTCHCSDLPHCTRKTVVNFPPFSSQSFLSQSTSQKNLSCLFLFCPAIFTSSNFYIRWLTLPTPHQYHPAF